MKKLIFSLSVLLCGFQMKAQTEILNGGFENWDSTSVDLPNSWFGFNIDTSFIYGTDTMDMVSETILKSTDSHMGDYAVKLVPDTLYGDEMPAILFYTGANNVEFDLFSEEDGEIPLQAVGVEVNSIYGYYKYFPADGDTAILAIGYIDSIGNIDEPDYMIADTITDTVATYTQFVLEAPTGISVDSFMMAFIGGSNIGTYLLLDDISIEANVGIVEHESTNVNVFQNLENNAIRLVTEEGLSGASVRLVSMQGKVVWSDTMYGTEKLISVDGLPKGVYLIQLGKKLNTQNTQKIIIR